MGFRATRVQPILDIDVLSLAIRLAVATACILPLWDCGTVCGDGFQAEPWCYNPLQWTLTGDVFHASGNTGDFAVMQTSPLSDCVTVEADVEASRAVGNGPRFAGVVIMNDQRNFWQLALVLPVEPTQRPACTLSEMRNAQWIPHEDTEAVDGGQNADAWQLGQRYHLRLAINAAGIEGVLADSNRHILRTIRHRLPERAAYSGRPALRCEGLETTFQKIETTCTQQATVSNVASAAIPYQSDSFVKEINGEKTGFFHVARQGDTWWAIDPHGRGYVPLGVDHASFQGHNCEKLGYGVYGRNNEAKYSTHEPWIKETLDRLHAWGFNLLGAGCSPELFHRGLAHTVFLSVGLDWSNMGGAMAIMLNGSTPGDAFPNVFHPDFEAFCRYRAWQVCELQVNDPWLFGYFIDNELGWWAEGTPETGLFELTMHTSADHAAKLALRDFLAERYGKDIEKFNQAWGSQLKSFDEILQRDHLSGTHADTAFADKKAFVALIADRYFDTIGKAIRAVDPNHMVLGSRFAYGMASDDTWLAAGRNCEIISFNYYGNVDMDKGICRDHRYNAQRGETLVQAYQTYYDWGHRPMMCTEWSFPSLDAGLPSAHGAGQRFRTQAERAKATEITERTMLALPFMVGHDYFMWVDEPASGIAKSFPEDSNYGLVNEDGRPYEILTATFARVHQEAGRLRREGPSKAGVMMADDPPTLPLSAITCFLEKHAPSQAGGTVPAPSLRFDRKGDEFTAATGAFEFHGRIGDPSLVGEVRHRGLVLGQVNGTAVQYTNKEEWIDVERLVDVKPVVGAESMTLDLTGRYEAPTEGERQSFEMTFRVTVSPERDWFILQLLSCRNLSEQPMDLRGIAFRLYSRIGGSAADDYPFSSKSVPRLWGNVDGDAWLNAKQNAFWGLTVDDASLRRILFYLDDPNNKQRPEALLEVNRQLAPQEVFHPATPVSVLCVAGRGDGSQWQEQAQKAMESLTSP